MQYVKWTGSHRQLYEVSDTCAYIAIKIKLTHISLMCYAKMHLQRKVLAMIKLASAFTSNPESSVY